MITAKQKTHAPGRKNAGDQIWTLCTAWVFPHLRAGAVRCLLSSKPKRRKLKKVPRSPGMRVPQHREICQFRPDDLEFRSSLSLILPSGSPKSYWWTEIGYCGRGPVA
jgi:hypothetical protein